MAGPRPACHHPAAAGHRPRFRTDPQRADASVGALRGRTPAAGREADMSPTTVPSMELVDLQDRKQLRGAFGSFPTGVTVVTVGGDSPRGMTANSFTSVSLSPPLLLICVGKDAVMHGSLDRSPTFSVSVLDADQEAVARHFADHSRPAGAGQFDAVGWQPGHKTGAPLIAGAVAHLECEKRQMYEGGDHTVFLGEVIAAARWPLREALLFSGGCFRRFGPEHAEGRVT